MTTHTRTPRHGAGDVDDLRTARIVTAVVLIIAWITAVWIITLYTVLA